MKTLITTIKYFTLISVLILIFYAAPDIRAEETGLPKGTQITLQLNNALSTASNMEGDEFTATVVNPVHFGGRIVVSKGSIVAGSVSRILRRDRLNGKAVMDMMFQSIRIPGYKQADIAVTLIRIDQAENSAKQAPNRVMERERPTGNSGNSGKPKIGVRPQASSGNTIGIGVSGGIPSVFNSQGDDVIISRGSSIVITLDRPLTLVKETGKPARK